MQLTATVYLDHAPWHNVGLARIVEIDNTWREVKLIFAGSADEPKCKIMIAPPLGTGRVSLAGISLRQADITGLPAGESLEDGSVSMPLAPEDCLERTPRLAADFVDFLFDVDQRYFQVMRDFLHQELHVKHPIKGTQVDQYSSYFSQAQGNFLNAHGYWQHPSFPRKPWDPNDWTVTNSPMINHGCEVPVELAGCRVRGQPYNVSGYPPSGPQHVLRRAGAHRGRHRGPARLGRHHLPLLERMELRLASPPDGQGLAGAGIDNYFNHVRHSVKRVTLPFGALTFRRGDVAPAREELAIGVTLDDEKQWLIDLPHRARLAVDPRGRSQGSHVAGRLHAPLEPRSGSQQRAALRLARARTGAVRHRRTDLRPRPAGRRRAHGQRAAGQGRDRLWGRSDLRPGRRHPAARPHGAAGLCG